MSVALFHFYEEATAYEIALIFFMDGLGRLTNRTIGGEGTPGAIVSVETRQKRSKALKGRKHSAEHVRKSADAKRGQPLGKRKLPPTFPVVKVWQGFISPDGV